MPDAAFLKNRKIAVVCCGLGHVYRGIEAWADDLAKELVARGINTALFKGGGRSEAAYEIVVPCIRRDARIARILTAVNFPGKWRTPLASPYVLEAFSFAKKLIPQLGNQFDIVHTQDPYVAQILHRAAKKGVISAKVILANGTEESPEFLSGFDYVQELDEYGLSQGAKDDYPRVFVAPNFVDTTRFCPADATARDTGHGTRNTINELRTGFGIPEDAYIVLTVGAVQRQLKRTDWLIKEFADFAKNKDTAYLLIAGARTDESDELIDLARRSIGDRFKVLENIDRDQMPDIYRLADVFAFCVVHGIYGIALAEAASTGLPCVVHDWERVKWVAGPRGVVVDMERKGELAAALDRLRDAHLRKEISKETRTWAVENLSKKVVLDKYIEMYERVTE